MKKQLQAMTAISDFLTFFLLLFVTYPMSDFEKIFSFITLGISMIITTDTDLLITNYIKKKREKNAENEYDSQQDSKEQEKLKTRKKRRELFGKIVNTIPFIFAAVAIFFLLFNLFRLGGNSGIHYRLHTLVIVPLLALITRNYQIELDQNAYPSKAESSEFIRFAITVINNICFGAWIAISRNYPYYYRQTAPEDLSFFQNSKYIFTNFSIYGKTAIRDYMFSFILQYLFSFAFLMLVLFNIFSCLRYSLNLHLRESTDKKLLTKIFPYAFISVAVIAISAWGLMTITITSYPVDFIYYFVCVVAIILIFLIYFVTYNPLKKAFAQKMMFHTAFIIATELLLTFSFFWVLYHELENRKNATRIQVVPTIIILCLSVLLFIAVIMYGRHVYGKIDTEAKPLLAKKTKKWVVALIGTIGISFFLITQYGFPLVSLSYSFERISSTPPTIVLTDLDVIASNVTVTNISDESVDLSGWWLETQEDIYTGKYIFPVSTILDAGASIIIERSDWPEQAGVPQQPFRINFSDNALLYNVKGELVAICPVEEYDNPYLVDIIEINTEKNEITLFNNSHHGIDLTNWTLYSNSSLIYDFNYKCVIGAYESLTINYKYSGPTEITPLNGLAIEDFNIILFDSNHNVIFALVDDYTPYYVDIVLLDKSSELVFLYNNSDIPIDITGWTITSTLGNNPIFEIRNVGDIKDEPVIIQPHGYITIGAIDRYHPDFVVGLYIWNDDHRDDAILKDTYGNYISVMCVPATYEIPRNWQEN